MKKEDHEIHRRCCEGVMVYKRLWTLVQCTVIEAQQNDTENALYTDRNESKIKHAREEEQSENNCKRAYGDWED